MSAAESYYLLARCLASGCSEKNIDYVVRKLHTGRVDIQKFVKTGDNNLVLQAVFPILRRHKIDNVLPPELSEHLSYIYELNSERNKKIIGQIERINSSLKAEEIYPLYLKGAGNIIDGLYTDPGERILHDIDFLVEEKDFNRVVEILKREGYKSDLLCKPEYDPKHYPALYNDEFPAFVEVHRRHLGRIYARHFPVEPVFMDKVRPALLSDCYVMSDEHKVIHNFMGSQLESDGHYYAVTSLRSLYDLLLLSQRVNTSEVFDRFGYYKRQTSAYLELMYKSFNIPEEPSQHRRVISLHSIRHEINLRSAFVGRLSYYSLRMFYSYIRKPLIAMNDVGMRKALISKLGDRKWYARHLKNYFKV